MLVQVVFLISILIHNKHDNSNTVKLSFQYYMLKEDKTTLTGTTIDSCTVVALLLIRSY